MVSSKTVECIYQCKRCENIDRTNKRKIFVSDPRDEIIGLCGKCGIETVWRRIL